LMPSSVMFIVDTFPFRSGENFCQGIGVEFGEGTG